MEFDLENPIIAGADDHSDLFASESDHSTSFNGSPSSVSRQNAISLLVQVRFACGLDPFLIYLAANYIDRFLSRREIPSEKPWIVRLLCICCLSLAAKMMRKKKTDFPLADLQEDGFIFDSRTIKRMELLVLGALDWRMRSVTPLAFVDFFRRIFQRQPEALPRRPEESHHRDAAQGSDRDQDAGVQAVGNRRFGCPLSVERALPGSVPGAPVGDLLVRIC
ncbi:cyclin-D6-1 [Iris pallida]|uniref:Cyclin-D6-1 n=1 Tax=Iris pallida TaxID=29817 RepID=A0AAX6HRD9_IRIPA|nr:cyclin-D6-1 [Iris pallida]